MKPQWKIILIPAFLFGAVWMSEAQEVELETAAEPAAEAAEETAEAEWEAGFFFNTEIDGQIGGSSTEALEWEGFTSDLTVGASISKSISDMTSVSINFIDLMFYGQTDTGDLELTSNQLYFGPSFDFALMDELSLNFGFDLMLGYSPDVPVFAGFDLYYALGWDLGQAGLSGSWYHNMETGVNADNSGHYLLNWLIWDTRFDISSVSDSVDSPVGLFAANEMMLTTAFDPAPGDTVVWSDFYAGVFYEPLDFFSVDAGFNMISDLTLDSASEIQTGSENRIGGRVGTHFTADWFSIGAAFTPFWVQGTDQFETDFEIMIDIEL